MNTRLTVEQALQQAVAHHQGGRLQEAAEIYRAVLKVQPAHPDANHLCGVAASQAGDARAAMAYIGRAIAARPDVALYHGNLGVVLSAQGLHAEAIASYRRALSLDGTYADAHHRLGLLLQAQGWRDQALASLEAAVAAQPLLAKAWNDLGVLQFQMGDVHGAVSSYEKAVSAQPDLAEAHNNLGVTLKTLGRLDAAAACYERAIGCQPGYAEAHNNLGNVLRDQRRLERAQACYQRALELRPGYAEAHNNLATTLQDAGQLVAARASYARALDVAPDYAEALNNLGHLHNDMGEHEQAEVCLRKAIELKPGYAQAWANLLFVKVYSGEESALETLALAREFARHLADVVEQPRRPVSSPDPDRRLRVGYVSADFREHAVSYFLEPLLMRHDRTAFELFAYSNVVLEDGVTQRLRGRFDHWRDIRGMNDDEAAATVRNDGIDLLVDLSGHTAGNRLLLFARKPAPVQATWLGYPSTTGMTAIDYRITDAIAEPDGLAEAFNAEALWRLPGLFCCYQGPERAPEPAPAPPSVELGHCTFGCFNSYAKVTDTALGAWARILEAVPGSRLLLEVKGVEEPAFRGMVQARLQRLGIPPERVILEPRSAANRWVLYHRVDISLDTLPCNGGTTTMDSLWMGVPVVTLAGGHFAARMGLTILTHAGMEELAATSLDGYVQAAAALALDGGRLRAMRDGLRSRFAAGGAMDGAAFTHNMEAAYRQMWQRWCAQTERIPP